MEIELIGLSRPAFLDDIKSTGWPGFATGRSKVTDRHRVVAPFPILEHHCSIRSTSWQEKRSGAAYLGRGLFDAHGRNVPPGTDFPVSHDCSMVWSATGV
jgi:hypothetical protein